MSGTSIPAWVKPGAKCTCVDDRPWEDAGRPWETLPVFGVVYTVRAVEVISGHAFLHLVEISNPPDQYDEGGFGEVGFNVDEFRPVVSDTEELGIETLLYRKAGLKSKTPVRSVERA